MIIMSFTIAALQAAPRDVTAQTPESIAQLRFEEGLRQYDARDYEAALQSFLGALELSSSPNARLYVARCLRDLGRLAEAISEYHIAAREAEDLTHSEARYAATQQAADSERQAIASNVSWLVLRLTSPPPGLTIRVGEREVPLQALELPIPVDPGPVQVHAEAPGFQSSRNTLTLVAGQRRVVELTLSRRSSDEHAPDEDTDSLSTAPSTSHQVNGLAISTYTFIGLTIAAGAALSVLGALALQCFNDLQSECGDGPCPSGYAEEIEAGRAFRLETNVLIGVTAALAVTALALGIMTLVRRPRAGGDELSSVALTGSGLRVVW